MEYLATFHTHLGALTFAKSLEKHGLRSKMTPVPRAVSSSCGTGVRVDTDADILAHVSEDVDRIFACMGGRYELVFENEG